MSVAADQHDDGERVFVGPRTHARKNFAQVLLRRHWEAGRQVCGWIAQNKTLQGHAKT
jgi:hypothetical protein